jgi:hypothetical protein
MMTSEQTDARIGRLMKGIDEHALLGLTGRAVGDLLDAADDQRSPGFSPPVTM